VLNTILVGLPNAPLREKGGDNAQKNSPSPLSLFDDSSHHFVTSSLLNIGLFIILNAKTNTTFPPYSIRNSSLCAHIKTSRAAGLTPARPSLDFFWLLGTWDDDDLVTTWSQLGHRLGRLDRRGLCLSLLKPNTNYQVLGPFNRLGRLGWKGSVSIFTNTKHWLRSSPYWYYGGTGVLFLKPHLISNPLVCLTTARRSKGGARRIHRVFRREEILPRVFSSFSFLYLYRKALDSELIRPTPLIGGGVVFLTSQSRTQKFNRQVFSVI